MTKLKEIEVFSPATVANLSCGFDVLSLAIDAVGDNLKMALTDAGEVQITAIHGADLSFNVKENVASAVVLKMRSDLGEKRGVSMEIWKGYKPGSGLGSSAASAVGAAFAFNELLGRPFNGQQLLEYGRYGEFVASGAYICDNVAAALNGGVNLVKSYDPLEVLSLPFPPELWLVVIHPQIEMKTHESRSVLPSVVPMEAATLQAGNIAGFVHALHTGNYEDLGDCLIDALAEPFRTRLIPGYDLAQDIGKRAGALGGGISGSGPSMFFLCRGESVADRVKAELEDQYSAVNVKFIVYKSPISRSGTRVVNGVGI